MVDESVNLLMKVEVRLNFGEYIEGDDPKGKNRIIAIFVGIGCVNLKKGSKFILHNWVNSFNQDFLGVVVLEFVVIDFTAEIIRLHYLILFNNQKSGKRCLLRGMLAEVGSFSVDFAEVNKKSDTCGIWTHAPYGINLAG